MVMAPFLTKDRPFEIARDSNLLVTIVITCNTEAWIVHYATRVGTLKKHSSFLEPIYPFFAYLKK